jgi:FkbM family methyltransferase
VLEAAQTWLKRMRRRVRALPPFARKRGKFQRELFGRDYWIPFVPPLKDRLKETQPELYTVIRRLYGRYSGAFIDVGANVGQTLVKVLSVGGEIPYFGFEPNLNAAFFLRRFLQLNDLNNEYLIAPLALSNRLGPITLYRKGQLGSGSSTVAGHRKAHPSFKYRDPIIAVDGDRVVSTLGIERIAIVKVDVEGGELEVLEGLRATLAEHRPFVICEAQSIGHRSRDREVAAFREERQEELERLLRGMDYLPFLIGSDGSWTPAASLRIGQERGRDYLFVPKEERQKAPELFGVGEQRGAGEGPETSPEPQQTR